MPRPVESTMRTRRLNKFAKKVGRTRSGFEAMFNSSRLSHEASAGGSALRKLTEMSRQRREVHI